MSDTSSRRRPPPPRTLPCPHCDRVFRRPLGRIFHVSRKHGEEVEGPRKAARASLKTALDSLAVSVARVSAALGRRDRDLAEDVLDQARDWVKARVWAPTSDYVDREGSARKAISDILGRLPED